jgi:Domain of unknown function (DUF5671)
MGDLVTSDERARGTPWDVFIHLLAVIALYASISGALILAFQFANLALPDPTEHSCEAHDWVRQGVAWLLIFFPTYVWAWRSIEADLAANPGKRRLWIRTCPIYFTLFVAGLLALGDLACLVYYFMSGELTARFILKLAAILVVSGGVLWFYRDALRREPGPLPVGTRVLAYVASGAAALLVIAGFAVAGSPARARLARLDATRIANLDTIQDKIVGYWRNKAVLPTSLDQLTDPLSGFAAPRDPESKRPYGYRVFNPTSFQLCANFSLSNFHVPSQSWPSQSGRFWNHSAGHVCFTRTIDPDRYPPRKKAP